jgi:outer membrane protein assembly factor BamB
MIALGFVALLSVAQVEGSGDSWPGFRGDGTSRSTALRIPLRWSPSENIAWRTELPGYGQSSPVVWREHIYLTAVQGESKETLLVLCLDRATGAILWRRELVTSQKGRNAAMVSRAAPTAATDGEGVYALFESGDLIGLSHSGEVRWQRALAKEYGEVKNNHGLASSLAQTREAVIVLVDHGGPSYLLAVQKSDGKNLWKTDRPTATSWASPEVTRAHEREVVLTSGTGALACYDAAGGKELWKVEEGASVGILSLLAFEGRVFLAAGESNRRAAPEYAVRCMDISFASGEGAPKILWSVERPLGYHASPVVGDGNLYLVNKVGVVHCLDSRTGTKHYAERMESACWATPVVGTDHAFFFGTNGVTTVLKLGSIFEKVAVNRLWTEEEFRVRKEAAKYSPENRVSEPGGGSRGPGSDAMEKAVSEVVGDVVYGVAAVEGAFLIRTGTRLYCVRDGK